MQINICVSQLSDQLVSQIDLTKFPAPQISSKAQGTFLVSLSHTATIMVCHWIGQLTPTAFVSTYHTIAALLFSHRGYDKENKDELSCP